MTAMDAGYITGVVLLLLAVASGGAFWFMTGDAYRSSSLTRLEAVVATVFLAFVPLLVVAAAVMFIATSWLAVQS